MKAIALAVVLLSNGVAFAERFSDETRRVSFTLPEGFVRSDAQGPAGSWWLFVNAQTQVTLAVAGLRGPLPKNSQPVHTMLEREATEAAKLNGLEVKRFVYRTVPWKGFALESVASTIVQGDQAFMTESVQVPRAGEAVQLVVAGPEASHASISSTVDRVLSTFEAETNWGDDEPKRAPLGLLEVAAVVVVLGAVVAWRRSKAPTRAS